MVVAHEVGMEERSLAWMVAWCWPLHGKAAEKSVRSCDAFGDVGFRAFVHESPERRQHIRTASTPSRVIVVTPADIVAQECAEGVEVAGLKSGSHLLGEVVRVVDGTGHAPIIPARAVAAASFDDRCVGSMMAFPLT